MYVLEHAGDFVRAHALKPDDVIGLSSADVRPGKGCAEGCAADACVCCHPSKWVQLLGKPFSTSRPRLRPCLANQEAPFP